jgi:hypothetical protein
MATSTTVAQFVGRIQKYEQAVAKIGPTAVKLNAANAKANAEASVREATGGSGRLRNAGALQRGITGTGHVVGRKGAELTVRTRIGEESASVSAVGPWQLIEYPTAAHYIAPAGKAQAILAGPTLNGKPLKSKSGRATAKGRTGRAKALRTPFGLKAHVVSRGTKGKRPWHKAYEKTTAEAPQGLKRAADAELGKL